MQGRPSSCFALGGAVQSRTMSDSLTEKLLGSFQDGVDGARARAVESRNRISFFLRLSCRSLGCIQLFNSRQPFSTTNGDLRGLFLQECCLHHLPIPLRQPRGMLQQVPGDVAGHDAGLRRKQSPKRGAKLLHQTNVPAASDDCCHENLENCGCPPVQLQQDQV